MSGLQVGSWRKDLNLSQPACRTPASDAYETSLSVQTLSACRSRPTASGAKATTDVEVGGRRSEINLFGYIQGVVHLDSEISDGAFQLGVTEEKLDGTQITSLPINLGRLRAAHRVRAVRC
jgi:hypothetical protein